MSCPLRIDWRLVRNCALLVLPSVVLTALSVYFLVNTVPGLVREQRTSINNGYRKLAERLVKDPSYATWSGDWRPEWQPPTRLNVRGRLWGWRPVDGRVLVWVAERTGRPERLIGGYADVIDAIDPGTLEMRLHGLVLAAMGLSLLSVFAAVWFFRRYAKEREDFLGATVHELMTPLVGIRGELAPGQEDARQLVERMLRIVRNVTDYLRLGGRRPPPAREAFDLVGAWHEAYSMFAEDFAEEESGPIALEAPSGLTVVGDRTLTVQILWNLIGNEYKYAAAYGPVGARLRSGSGDGLAVVEIFDGGPGMSPGERRRAFDRCYRAKGSRKSGKGGFGLGLCTSREFARAMGGDLAVGPNSPRGCIFTFTIPRNCGIISSK